MSYVDGYLLPIPRKNLQAYRRMARTGAKVWKSHGALEYRELVLDDPRTFCGLTFQKGARAKRGETVVLAWVVYKSKAHRDAVNRKVMADPRLQEMMKGKPMPFDMNRMMYGGFKAIVEA